MNTAFSETQKALSVKATDELMAGIESAHARIAEVYAAGRNTLIDSISSKEWLDWDGAGEKAIVMDPFGLDGMNEADDSLPIAA